MKYRDRIIIRICKPENKAEKDAVILGLTMSLGLPHSKTQDLIEQIEKRAEEQAKKENE